MIIFSTEFFDNIEHTYLVISPVTTGSMLGSLQRLNIESNQNNKTTSVKYLMYLIYDLSERGIEYEK